MTAHYFISSLYAKHGNIIFQVYMFVWYYRVVTAYKYPLLFWKIKKTKQNLFFEVLRKTKFDWSPVSNMVAI